MFTKKRFFNLKFVFMSLLMAVFIITGLFVKTTNLEAAGIVRYVNASYTLSEVVSTTNSNGEVTTKVLVGCAPGSKDVFDINTGKPCVRFTKTVLIGCAPLSGDLYDINTGKRCASAPIVLTGCMAGSGDIYDITNGKRCINDTKVKSIVVTNTIKTNVVAKMEPATTKSIASTPTEKLVAQVMELNQIKNEPVETVNKDNDLSGREKIKGSLMASVGRVGSIFNGPMLPWIIILIIIIIIGGGYGIYSFQKKDETSDLKPMTSPITPKIINPNPQVATSKEYAKSEQANTNFQTNSVHTNPVQPTLVNTESNKLDNSSAINPLVK